MNLDKSGGGWAEGGRKCAVEARVYWFNFGWAWEQPLHNRIPAARDGYFADTWLIRMTDCI